MNALVDPTIARLAAPLPNLHSQRPPGGNDATVATGADDDAADDTVRDRQRAPTLAPSAHVTFTHDEVITIITAPGAEKTVTLMLGHDIEGDSIDLCLLDAYAGLSADLSDHLLTRTEHTELTINVGREVSPGAYRISILGTAPGEVVRVTVDVLVVPDVTSRGLVLHRSPTLSTMPGTNAATLILVDREPDVIGDISFGISGAPDGMFAAFDENPTSRYGGRLVITCSGSVEPGTYPITVSADALDHNSGSCVILVTVMAPQLVTV